MNITHEQEESFMHTCRRLTGVFAVNIFSDVGHVHILYSKEG